MYAEKGVNLNEAVQLIEKALELEPKNGYYVDSLGWAFYQQGRYPEALRELKRAVELAKDDAVIFEHLGDASLKTGSNARPFEPMRNPSSWTPRAKASAESLTSFRRSWGDPVNREARSLAPRPLRPRRLRDLAETPTPPLSPEVRALLEELEARWKQFEDLRGIVELTLERRETRQRFTGPLLLKAPASLRFEALSPLGQPLLIVAMDGELFTLYSLHDDRAVVGPATERAMGRWLDLPLPPVTVVALLAGHVLPPPEISAGTLVRGKGPLETRSPAGWSLHATHLARSPREAAMASGMGGRGDAY